MENFPDGDIAPEFTVLSYDDTVAYEEQVPTHPSNDPGRASLANRIGSTKVYLLSESSVARVGKRKHGSTEDALEDEIEMEEEDLSYRANALLFHGTPISHLPTARLFAYAKHFDAHPMGLEWIDDNTCIFVFDSKAAARSAHRFLQKSAVEEADDDGFVTAKPIPIALWPPEEQINKSLGKGSGVKGTIRMRWAKGDDVKKRGAKKDSQFYKKHGKMAGKEVYGERGDAPQKRRKQDFAQDDLLEKSQLDDDLDEIVAQDSPSPPPSPPSKMRSDYISKDGKTLLERTSLLRVHPTPLEDRITAPLPRRARGPHGRSRLDNNNGLWVHDASVETKGDRRPRKGHKSQQELDDELEAFLNERS